MTTTLMIGLDGTDTGDRALAHGARLSTLIGDCELLLVYVIEWSPYSFQTAEENEQRKKRREEEISIAKERVIEPAIERLRSTGLSARGLVRHGDVADTLDAVAIQEQAEQIVVGRASDGGFARRLFGSSTANLVMNASVPVTVVN